MKEKHNPKDFGKVVVLTGGDETKRERSHVSGKRILDLLRQNGIDAQGLEIGKDIIQKLSALKPDLAFIALHGNRREDGTLQGLLQYMGIPYTGSGMAASAIAADKPYTKLIWQSTEVPTVRFRLVNDIETAIEVMQELALPLCIKPVSSGARAGVSKVTTPEELLAAFKKASAYTRTVMIEPWITGVQYSVPILGTLALPVVELERKNETFISDNKISSGTNFLCPSDLSKEAELAISTLAFRAFQAIGCRGWGVVDLIKDDIGNLWFLEINTAPDMDENGVFEKSARSQGLSNSDINLEVMEHALFRSKL